MIRLGILNLIQIYHTRYKPVKGKFSRKWSTIRLMRQCCLVGVLRVVYDAHVRDV